MNGNYKTKIRKPMIYIRISAYSVVTCFNAGTNHEKHMCLFLLNLGCMHIYYAYVDLIF